MRGAARSLWNILFSNMSSICRIATSPHNHLDSELKTAFPAKWQFFKMNCVTLAFWEVWILLEGLFWLESWWQSPKIFTTATHDKDGLHTDLSSFLYFRMKKIKKNLSLCISYQISSVSDAILSGKVSGKERT